MRARDEAGNRDSNTVEVSATTPDAVPPTFAGATGASAISASEIDVSWAAGSDNDTAVSALVYDLFVATTSGGQTYATADIISYDGEPRVKLGREFLFER